MLTGLALRTWNVNFDGGLNAHPDERSTTCFYAPTIAWPSSVDEFLDPRRSPLNPLWDRQNDRRRSFTYGHFPLYLGILTGELLNDLAKPAGLLPLSGKTIAFMERANTPCDGVAVAGRLLIALLDTLTILLLFLLGRRLYGAAGGLLAAGLYALTAQAVQLSHFFAMDPASTTFTVLSVYGGVLMVQERSWRGVLYAGIGAGLAISTKFSALPILAAPVAAALIVLWQAGARSPHVADGERGLDGVGRMLVGAPLALLLACATFFITSPYAVLDWASFIQATLVEQGRMVRGTADFPFTRQYRNTIPYLYFIQQQVVWGMGLPLGLIALAGSGWALVKVLLQRARAGELIVWAWVVPYFGITGAFLAKFNRYMSPILPFILLFAAGLIVWLWQLGNRATFLVDADRSSWRIWHRRNWLAARLAAALLALIALGGGLFWSVAYANGVYGNEHTWITASRWVYANVPNGSVILWELWDDPLPKSIPGEPGMDMGSHGLRHIEWSPYEEDTPDKYEILRQKLSEADYVIYSSKRIYGSVDELPERYPMTTRYYDLMFGEQLGFVHAADFTSPPRLLGLTFPDQEADESWSLYDHPRVSIFAKQRSLSDSAFDALLGGSWEGAIPWHRGREPPLGTFLNFLGLGSSPESQDRGLINIMLALLQGQEIPAGGGQSARREWDGSGPSLLLETPLSRLPLVDNYRWNAVASENTWLAVGWWWLVVSLLGWTAWPLAFVLFRGLRDRGFLVARTLGWLLSGWLLWLFASVGLAHNTVRNAWLVVALVALINVVVLTLTWKEVRSFLRRMWGILLVGEGLFAAAFLLFVLIRRANPDIWQPWFGGEKFMEFAFLNGILRSPSFPPVDPHFAGGYINYYYYGIYLVAYLVKLTGIYAEVAFNLAIPTLFALTVLNAFGVAYSAVAKPKRSAPTHPRAAHAPSYIAPTGRPTYIPSSDGPEYTAAADGPDLRPTSPSDSPGAALLLKNWSRWQGQPEPLDDPDADAPAPRAGSGPNVTSFTQTAFADDMMDDRTAPPRRLDALPPKPGSKQAPLLPWHEGIGMALLAPLFVAVIGNLAGFGQLVHTLARASESSFQSANPGVQKAVYAVTGLWRVLTTDAGLPGYDFWAPSRVIPHTINEFPYWSFTFADLHPHMIGIPLSIFFLALTLALLNSYDIDWRRNWGYGALLLGAFTFTLGVLTVVNLWELPTYFGLGLLTLVVTLYRGRRGRRHRPQSGSGNAPLVGAMALGALQLAGVYLLFLPFFRNFTNVAASGVGLVRVPDDLGQWAQIWGFFAFILFTWLLGKQFVRLLRYVRLVGRPTAVYLMTAALLPLLVLLSLGLWIFSEQKVLALCLPFLGLSLSLLWRRGRAADTGALCANLLAATGLAILAGTQVIFLKDFLQGGDAYRMNTLFKFFNQVWVLWGVAAAIALPRIFTRFPWPFSGNMQNTAPRGSAGRGENSKGRSLSSLLSPLWGYAFLILLLTGLAYPLWGTAARASQRFPGWRPPIGTLDGMAFMEEGVYYWPDGDNAFELRYDWEAIQWLLANVRGNVVVTESAQLDYYRAGGSRVASLTGLSGLMGMHEGEQRYGRLVGERHGLLNEFWRTDDIGRIHQIIAELDIGLIYVGQLERHQHAAAVERLTRMEEDGALQTIYRNPKVTIYAVPSRMMRMPDGAYTSVQG